MTLVGVLLEVVREDVTGPPSGVKAFLGRDWPQCKISRKVSFPARFPLILSAGRAIMGVVAHHGFTRLPVPLQPGSKHHSAGWSAGRRGRSSAALSSMSTPVRSELP